MKIFLSICLFVFLSTAATIADISFSGNSWITQAGITQEGDTLTFTGDAAKYLKAQLTVSVPATTENLYFTADIFLENLVTGEKTYQQPKFKLYDGATSIQAYNMPATIQDSWYTTGMVQKRFDNLGLTQITLEFGLQNCTGTMRVANPQLLDTPPASNYEYPFETPTDNSVTLLLDPNEKIPFNNDLLSVNSHFVWASSDWSGSDVTAILKERLPLGNLRFPGGTVGNFYDWETDGFYGDEWTFLSPSRKKAYEEGFRFAFDGYVARCKEINASSTLMFNVIQDDVAKAKARLQNRIASGIDIKWIEMGNENFFTEQAYGNVATTQDYINHTKALVAGLKEITDTIPLAINMDHHDWTNGSHNQLLAAETHYDACVMHPYVSVNSFMLNSYSASVMLSSYKKTKERIEQYKATFGEKPLLFTEWGVLSEGNPSNFIQALATADLFLAITEGADDSTVQQAGIHMLYHSDNYNEATLYFQDGGVFKKTRLAVLYEKIVEVFKDSHIYRIVGKSAEVADGVPGIIARAVSKGDTVFVFAVNKTPDEGTIELQFPEMNRNTVVTVETFSETILGDSAGYSLNENPWSKTTQTGLLSIPAQSISVFTIPDIGTSVINPVKKLTKTEWNVTKTGIIIKTEQAVHAILYNTQGKIVAQSQIQKSGQIQRPAAKGIYYLKLEAAQQTEQYKVMF